MLWEVAMAGASATTGEGARDNAWRHKHVVEIDTQSICQRGGTLASAVR